MRIAECRKRRDSLPFLILKSKIFIGLLSVKGGLEGENGCVKRGDVGRLEHG
jgi:hypothetical protein